MQQKGNGRRKNMKNKNSECWKDADDKESNKKWEYTAIDVFEEDFEEGEMEVEKREQDVESHIKDSDDNPVREEDLEVEDDHEVAAVE